jgi:hypothetical protein
MPSRKRAVTKLVSPVTKAVAAEASPQTAMMTDSQTRAPILRKIRLAGTWQST